jgi:hypothetical protein
VSGKTPSSELEYQNSKKPALKQLFRASLFGIPSDFGLRISGLHPAHYNRVILPEYARVAMRQTDE